jgi:putative nucleotidyltransferase with HDIG domain
MTAKVLQLVNSSFLGLPTKITTPSKAVSLLGLDMVRAIALTAGAFSKYGNLKIPGFSIDEMWHHGLNCGVIVKLIAQAEKLPRQELETAFMAALLHDIGKILLAIHMPEQFSQALHATNSGQIPFHEAEYSVIGATHAELGAYLLGLWGLPESVVQAVCQHHQLRAEPAGGLTTELIVHVANALEHADAEVLTSEAPLKGIDHAHLSALGYGQRLAHWRQLCATRLDEA